LHSELPRTEQLAPNSAGLDNRENSDVLKALWEGQQRAIASIETAIPQISNAADAIIEHLKHDAGRIIYAGAGSSGLLAMQDGMELTPTFNWPASRLVFMMAGGDKARLSPIGVEEDDTQAALRDIEKINLQPQDVIIAVAASGTTPYTVSVLEQASTIGTLSIGIANNAGTEVLTLSSFPILLDSGPEVIAGSTRLGAGTAQKAALGMLSSLLMTRLGHVVDGWMVSMVADNIKLKERAERIVTGITNCAPETARRSLEQSEGDVKIAVLIAQGYGVDQAKKNLNNSNGHLRAAMET